jgi:hypothetical protein
LTIALRAATAEFGYYRKLNDFLPLERRPGPLQRTDVGLVVECSSGYHDYASPFPYNLHQSSYSR